MAAIHRKYKNGLNPDSGMIDGLPKKFVKSMQTLFEIMDEERTGFLKVVDIENRWQDNNMKSGMIESLRRVSAPTNGLLSFDQFCAGLKLCLLQTQATTSKYQRAYPPPPPGSLELASSDIVKSQWNNTVKVKPNNASILPSTSNQPPNIVQETLQPTAIAAAAVTLKGPPKPPRLMERNINRTDRFNRAEIRNALQSWQIDVLMNDIDNLKTQSSCNSDDGVGQNVVVKSSKRREPRRHTLQNVIDLNILKRLKQYEQEKDVLRQGLNGVENARDWYLQQITNVQNKINYLGRTGAHVVSRGPPKKYFVHNFKDYAIF